LETLVTRDLASAKQAVREVRSGRSFTSLAGPESIYAPSSPGADVAPNVLRAVGKLIINERVFAAKPHMLTGPVKAEGKYWLFEVTHITHSFERALAEVEGGLRGQLLTEGRTRALADFVRSWREKWTARTSCQPEYVVRKCKQFHEPQQTSEAEDPYTLN
jgi:hypothetical protein